jgi:hypothetical protein
MFKEYLIVNNMGLFFSILKRYLLICEMIFCFDRLNNGTLHYNINYGKEKKKTFYQAQ